MTAPEAATGPIAILGGGNVGQALGRGLLATGRFRVTDIMLTRLHVERLAELTDAGLTAGADNRAAVAAARQVVVAVQPRQLDALLSEIRATLDARRHTLISVVTGATIGQIRAQVGGEIPVVRAMPNTAIAIGQSMTCLAALPEHRPQLEQAKLLFDSVGTTLEIDEALMESATALCACGIAFFLRAVRAASQGGIEIGFHPKESLLMAAQTALGAAGLLMRDSAHPEPEIDRVTTPRGCTIAGLNEMEHRGFSSAMIKGIVTSAKKAVDLYQSPVRADQSRD
jgi:pyrroline-5-carboxylate reductase